jgi:hypothetical protein
LNRLNEIAPSAFDKAKLLLLSQSDRICRDDYELGCMKDCIFTTDAIEMLRTEKNGRINEARELLAHLRKTGRFSYVLGEPYETAGSTSTQGSVGDLAVENPNAFGKDGSLTVAKPEKTDTKAQSGGAPIPVVKSTGDKPSSFRRWFMSWFRPQSVHEMHAPMPAPGCQGSSVIFPRDDGGPGGVTGAPPSICDRPPNELPVVDINWFK